LTSDPESEDEDKIVISEFNGFNSTCSKEKERYNQGFEIAGYLKKGYKK